MTPAASRALSRFLLILGLAGLVSAAASVSPPAPRAQLGLPLGAGKLVTGEWVSYWNMISIPGARRDTLWERIAVVESDNVSGKPAHWIEVTLQGTLPRATPLLVKTLVLDSGAASQAGAAGGVRAATAAQAGDEDLSYVVRLIVKKGKAEAIELKLPEAAPFLHSLLGRGGIRPALAQIVRDDSLDLGEETVETTRGSRAGRHTSFVSVIARPSGDTTDVLHTYSTDVWTSPDIPVTGIVRSSTRTLVRPPDPGRETERVDMVLDGYGVGARPRLTGRVRLVTVPQVPLETGIR